MCPQTVPTVQTDKPGYKAGDTVTGIRSGFTPSDNVTLQVTTADGTAEASMGDEPWSLSADASGD